MKESRGADHVETRFQDTSCCVIPLIEFLAIKCTCPKSGAHVERKGLFNSERVCRSVRARFVGPAFRELIEWNFLSIEKGVANFTVCSTVLSRTGMYGQMGSARAVGIHRIFERTASRSTVVVTLVYRVYC